MREHFRFGPSRSLIDFSEAGAVFDVVCDSSISLMIVLFRDGKRRFFFFLVCHFIRMMSIDAVCVASRIGMLDCVFEIMRQFLQKEVIIG